MRILGALLCLGSVAHAAGWVRPVGAWYAKIDNRILIAERGYPAGGGAARDTGGRYSDWALALYGELGVTPRVTAIISATPIGHARFEDRRSAVFGERINAATAYVGPISGGARWAVLQGRLNLAIEARYGWAPPVGDRVVGAGAYDCAGRTCGDFFWQPTVASHRFDAELQLGVSLPGRLWLSGAAGGRAFVGVDQDPALRGFGQLGWRALDWLGVEGHVDAWQPTGAVVTDALAGSGQTRYVGLGVSVSVQLGDGIAVRLARDGARGVEANAAAAIWSVGVELEHSK